MVYERSAAVGLGLALGFGTLLGGDALNAPDPSESCPTFPSKDPTGPFAERAIGSNAAKLALKDIVNIFGVETEKEDPTTLPQDSRADKKARADELVLKKEAYPWGFEGILKLPHLDGSPPEEEEPSTSWTIKFHASMIRALIGTTRGTVGVSQIVEAASDPVKLRAFVARVKEFIRDTERDERPVDLEDYNDLHTFPLKTPRSLHDWNDDEAFARRRLQGVNPVAIQKCTQEQRAKLKILEDPSYAELREKVDNLLAAGKLFVVDHGRLNGMETDLLDGSIERYLTAGIGLFEWVDDEMLPIRALGIQLDQGDGETATPIFTPNDPYYTWSIAKACFEASDQLCHEAVSHLGSTHMVLEIPLVAMNRCLASSHPLYKLLKPHLEGTAHINWIGLESLVPPGGAMDRIYASKIEPSWDLIRDKVLDSIKGDFSLPADIAARGVSVQDLPGQYMYRDIGLKYWDAIYTWVQEYFAIYYTSEADLDGDYELQAFVDEMVTKGSFKWLEELATTTDPIDTIRLLSKVFASLIYSSSVLHAAVNFPQATSTAYVPSSPGAVYAAPPTTKAEKTFEDFLAYLPPMEISTDQVSIMTLLGSVFHTELGEYEGDHFTDVRVAAPLARFQDKLEDIGSELSDLNAKVVSNWKARGKNDKVAANFGYKTLLPEKIPQSTNI